MMFFACSERNKKRRLSQREDRSETGNSGKYLPTDANELGHTNRQHTDADTHNSCTARIEITSIFPIESTERRSQESIALIKEFCPKRIFSNRFSQKFSRNEPTCLHKEFFLLIVWLPTMCVCVSSHMYMAYMYVWVCLHICYHVGGEARFGIPLWAHKSQ